MLKKTITIAIIVYLIFIAIKFRQAKDTNIPSCNDCNVILIGIDALRADHLGAYGYEKPTSPNIDVLANQGILFKNNYSQSITTSPSFMSLFTSLYPTDHGILFTNPASYGYPVTEINKDIQTLPEIMQRNGYKTAAFVTSSALPPEMGFSRGFDKFSKDSVANQRNNLINWIKSNKDKRFFAFYHDLSPHAPYIPSEKSLNLFEKNASTLKIPETPSKVLSGRSFFSSFDSKNPKNIEHLTNLYDGTIRDVDDFIGQLTTEIKEEKIANKTIVVFMADHGEELVDHGTFGHQEFYNEVTHIPLIISIPGYKNETINQNTRTIDIMPTLFDILGIKTNILIRGTSLVPVIKNPLADMKLPTISIMGQGKSIIADGYKFIDQIPFQPDLSKPITLELYNLKNDPLEKNDLIKQNLSIQKTLENLYLKTVNDNRYSKNPTIINDPSTSYTEELKELGY